MPPELAQILIFFLAICNAGLASFTRKRYAVNMEMVSLCPDNNQLEIPMRMYRMDRINRTHRAITMDFAFAHPIDENVEGNVVMERWANGAWLNIPVFHYQNDICNKVMNSNLKPVIDIFVQFLKALGVKHPEKCEIPAGNYSVKNYPVDITSDISFFNGRFRSTVILRRVQNKKKMFCTLNILSLSEI